MTNWGKLASLGGKMGRVNLVSHKRLRKIKELDQVPKRIEELD